MKTILRSSLFGIVLVITAIDTSAANRTWDGGDPDFSNLWSSRTNWNGNTNIAAGDALFFPGTAVIKTMQNDLSSSNFAKLTFNDDAYILNGNSLRLTNGIKANYFPTGPTRINVGITLGDDAAFEADDGSATLELNGPVNLLGFTLTNQGVGNITWLAPFRSAAGGILRKLETGTVTVRSTNASFLGTVELSGGDFNVNGRMPAGTINVNSGGTLGGTGLVHAVTVNSRGILAPGGSARGVLTVTNSLTLLRGGSLEAEILGTTAGQFDQLNILGTVSLTNAVLNLTVGFIPASPVAVTLIANDGADPVLGTFNGLPQGATVLVTDFIRANISYTGGTGNDVVLTVSPVDTLAWTGSASGLWSVGANWVGGIAPQPGDSLIFPVVSVRKTTTNDFPADTVFGLMRLETNYVLLGARAALRRGLHTSHTGFSPSVLMPLLLVNHQTFTNQFQDITFSGDLDLGGFNLILLSGSGAVDVTMTSSIRGVGAVTVEGPGQVSLDRSNSFTGVLDARGRVVVRHPAALGTPAQATLVGAGSELLLSASLPDDSNIGEPLNLTGTVSGGASNLSWSGNVTFESPQARVFLNANQSLAFTSATLGTNGFIKDGPGLLRLATIQAAHGGTTFVKAGTLQVDTAMTNSALVVSNGATVAGTGTVRQATILSGGILSPGASAGILTVTQSLVMQGTSVFRVEINGPTAEVDCDQLDVRGTVNLGAGTAVLDVQPGFTPTNGQSFTILRNDLFDGISGSFAGWLDGAIVSVDGVSFQIDYQGGTGNDIVLTKQPETRTWSGLGANNLWSTPQNWAGNLAPTPGDILIFPPTAARRTNQNDFPTGTPIHSLDVRGSYQLEGAEIGLRAGVFAAGEAPRWEMKVPVTLLGSQTFSLSNNFNFGMIWDGPIQLETNTLTLESLGLNPMTVRGAIAGSGHVRKTGPDGIHFNATNTYARLTRVDDGFLELRNRLNLGTTNSGTVVSNGALLILNAPELMDPLTLTGELTILEDAAVTAPLTVAGHALIRITTGRVATFTQPVAGGTNLVIQSQSASGPAPDCVFPGTNPVNGSVTARGATLHVDGSIPNAALTLETHGAGVISTLTGTGLVRALTVGMNCVLSPAGTNGGDGTISTLTVTQSLVMSASSRYRVNLNGLNVQNYDQLDVLGTVNLGAGVANLDVQLGFTPPEGHTFIILDNDGLEAITGTFAGKPQNATFVVNGVRLQISYTGGTGNDIALTVLEPEEMTWTGAVNGNWSTPGNWSPARLPQPNDRLIFPGGTPRRFVTNNFQGAAHLHSLIFPGTGTSNNNFCLRGTSPSLLGDITLSSGLAVTNPATVEFQLPVILSAPQAFVARGSIEFAGSLRLNGDVSVSGNNVLRTKNLFGIGRLLVSGVNTELSGTCSPSGGFALSNSFLTYEAVQTSGAGARLTNSTFRLNAAHASVRGLLLMNSALDLTGGNQSPTALELNCDGDLEFLGASRLGFNFDAGSQPRLEVAGDVRLNNATLVINNISAAFGTPLTLIRNRGGNPVFGTFNFLPEGSEILAANGTRVVLSYFGGDSGDDVILTPVAPVTGLTRLWRGAGANGDWSQPANWVANLVPADGDSVEFPDAPKPINTNNLPAQRYNQLLFTGTSGVARVLAPNTNSFVGLQLLGGLDYRDTGTLRIPFTNAGFLNPRGLVQILAPQDFNVATGGTVKVDALIGLPGTVVAKTGGGILEVGTTADFFGAAAVPLRVRDGTLRVGQTTERLEQTGGTLDVLREARDVALFGGHFQTAPGTTNGGVTLAHLDAGGATNASVIRPGGENAVGLLTATNGITLNPNTTLRLDVATPFSIFGITSGTNDLIDLTDSGDFRPNGARLELNFLPGFNPSPTNFVLLTVSQNARTNLGTFASLPHLGLLTNEFGLFRIYYRDFVLPPPFNLFGHATNHDSVILERIAARPIMLAVTNGPGAFKTVLALGTPGALYVIEGSEDLLNWTALSGETASATTGRFSFADVSGLPYRFYRARLP